EQEHIKNSARKRAGGKTDQFGEKYLKDTDTVPERTEMGARISIFIDCPYRDVHKWHSLPGAGDQHLCLILKPLSRDLPHQIQKAAVKRPESCLCITDPLSAYNPKKK